MSNTLENILKEIPANLLLDELKRRGYVFRNIEYIPVLCYHSPGQNKCPFCVNKVL